MTALIELMLDYCAKGRFDVEITFSAGRAFRLTPNTSSVGLAIGKFLSHAR